MNTCPNKTDSMRVSHASRQISYGLKLIVFIHEKCIQETGGQWPTWAMQTLYTVNNSAEHCQKNPWPEEADELWATTWKMFRIDLLSHCVTYTLRPGNSAMLGKQWLKTKAHGTVPCCYSSQAAVCKNCHCKSCWEEKSKGAKKVSTANYLVALSNTQRNATHRNAVQYCGEIFSIFFIVWELEQWEKKN